MNTLKQTHGKNGIPELKAIEVKPKYRFLRVGEVIKEGDQYMSFSGTWETCFICVGEKVIPANRKELRRRV
jgi:hypothetical protein